MTNLPNNADLTQLEVYELADAVLSGAITAEQTERLNALVCSNRDARRHYVCFMYHSTTLRDWAAEHEERGQCTSEPSSIPIASPIPDLSAAHSSFLIPHSSPLPAFVGSVLFSYLVAAMVLGVGMLIGWAWKVQSPAQFVRQAVPDSSPMASSPSPRMAFVGRITGMVNCTWSDPTTAVPGPVAVPLGRKYALASGLLEITYDSGAKVILQGPVTYEVESAAGGYLSIGKLTARVEKKEERRTKNEEQLAVRSSFLIPHSYFAVRTPTATVTDLGTEFGVEVDKTGTTSQVFRGSVKIQPLGTAPGREASAVVLHENEAFRTEVSDGSGQNIAPHRINVDPHAFVRQLVRPPQIIDLLDIVAGGNGSGHRRERGIDPTTGMEDPVFDDRICDADGHYRSVVWNRLVDGVFVPDGRSGPVTLDSVGHAFNGFLHASGRVHGSIWPRATVNKPELQSNWTHKLGRGELYMPDNRGLLGMHANMGISFNLEAMRQRYATARPVRFRAVVGMAHPEGAADVWVFVDGQLKFSRALLHMQDGTVQVNVEIGVDDRFLTLVATDGGDGIGSDWVVFGDPIVEMARAEETTE